jgi:hypothetical protein
MVMVCFAFVAGGCSRAPSAGAGGQPGAGPGGSTTSSTQSLGGDVQEAVYYACPGDGEYADPNESNGLGCEIEQQVDGDDNAQQQFNFYPSATTDPGGGIYISDSYITASDSSDPQTLQQCCQMADSMTATAAKLPASNAFLVSPEPVAEPDAPNNMQVCGTFRRASGNQPQRVDGVKQWELEFGNNQVNMCGGAAGGPWFALRGGAAHTVRRNSTPVRAVVAGTTKAQSLALIRAGGLAGRLYELWLGSADKRDRTAINFGLADEKTPLTQDFCVTWRVGRNTMHSVQARATAGEGHPTIAATLNAGASERFVRSKGGFWACDGGEGTEPAANSTTIDNCSGRWPPGNAGVVTDAKNQMNAVTGVNNFWDNAVFRAAGACP